MSRSTAPEGRPGDAASARMHRLGRRSDAVPRAAHRAGCSASSACARGPGIDDRQLIPGPRRPRAGAPAGTHADAAPAHAPADLPTET